MTWPFENDTSGIVKRISNRSISANRKRNIFIVLTIVLASALLSAIVLYGFGVMQETQNRNQKTAQIMYHAISEQQGQELYKQEEIAWVGEFFNAFSEQVNHSTVNFTYANADMLRIPLIIAPKPSTSSPLTKISRKSAIQAHCLHAK